MLTIPTKTCSALQPQPLYAVPEPEPNKVTIIWRIVRTLVIPVIILIGLLIYYKRSKSNKKTKILVTLGIIALTVIAYFVINKII